MTTAREVAQRIVSGRGLPGETTGRGRAPANIALVKYWGTRDEELNLPVTGSLSISLGPLGSEVEVSPAEGPHDAIWLNSAPQPLTGVFARRASAYLDLFRPAPGY